MRSVAQDWPAPDSVNTAPLSIPCTSVGIGAGADADGGMLITGGGAGAGRGAGAGAGDGMGAGAGGAAQATDASKSITSNSPIINFFIAASCLLHFTTL